MPKFDIPPKENRTQQVVVSVIVLLIVSILVAIIAKLIVGLIIFLLGMIAGIGTKYMNGKPLDKE